MPPTKSPPLSPAFAHNDINGAFIQPQDPAAAVPGAPAGANGGGFDMQAMLAAFAAMQQAKMEGRLQLQREATAPRHLDMSGNPIDTVTPGANDPWKNGFFRTNQQRMDRTHEVLGGPGYEEATPQQRGIAAGQTLQQNPFLYNHTPPPDNVHTDLTDNPGFGMINPPAGRPRIPGQLPPLPRGTPMSPAGKYANPWG